MENIQKELDDAKFKMNEARELKNKYVSEQKWELAADIRDIERSYSEIVETLESQLK